MLNKFENLNKEIYYKIVQFAKDNKISVKEMFLSYDITKIAFRKNNNMQSEIKLELDNKQYCK